MFRHGRQGAARGLPAVLIRRALATLSPGYFAWVMASGITRSGTDRLGYQLLSQVVLSSRASAGACGSRPRPSLVSPSWLGPTWLPSALRWPATHWSLDLGAALSHLFDPAHGRAWAIVGSPEPRAWRTQRHLAYLGCRPQVALDRCRPLSLRPVRASGTQTVTSALTGLIRDEERTDRVLHPRRGPPLTSPMQRGPVGYFGHARSIHLPVSAKTLQRPACRSAH